MGKIHASKISTQNIFPGCLDQRRTRELGKESINYLTEKLKNLLVLITIILSFAACKKEVTPLELPVTNFIAQSKFQELNSDLILTTLMLYRIPLEMVIVLVNCCSIIILATVK